MAYGDTISRQAAIDALKNDMASLDHIIKGMSAYDVRLDAYVSQRNQVNYDIDTLNNLPTPQPEQLGTNLAEVGTDTISRQQAIDEIDEWIKAFRENGHKESAADACLIQDGIIQLPPTQPIEDIHREKEQAYYCGYEDGAKAVRKEQRTGYWYPVGMAEAVGGESAQWGSAIAYHRCSECDEQALCEFGQEVLSDFCPHCGAKMEGVSE